MSVSTASFVQSTVPNTEDGPVASTNPDLVCENKWTLTVLRSVSAFAYAVIRTRLPARARLQNTCPAPVRAIDNPSSQLKCMHALPVCESVVSRLQMIGG